MHSLHVHQASDQRFSSQSMLGLNCVHTCADLMSIMLWMTPAGTLDEGGVPQPAYLNFRQRLLHEPADADSFKARTRQLCSLTVVLFIQA